MSECTAVVCTGTSILVDPSGIVAEEGGDIADGVSEETLMRTPPTGAGWSIPTVRVAVCPPGTVLMWAKTIVSPGVQVRETIAGSLMVEPGPHCSSKSCQLP